MSRFTADEDRALLAGANAGRAADGRAVRAGAGSVLAYVRRLCRTLVLLLCCGSLCAAETRGPAWVIDESVDAPSSFVARVGGEPPIHRARFSLSSDDPDTADRPIGDDRDRGRLRWLVVGGVALLLLGVIASAAAGGGGDDDAPSVDPGVGSPLPDGGPPPGASESPDPGIVLGEPGGPSPSRARTDGFAPRQGLFFSVGTSRDGKRATERSRGFDEDGEFLSLGYDRRLADAVDAGLAVDLSRAAAAFDGSSNTRTRRSGTVLLFADYRLRPSSRLSAYAGLSTSGSESVRFSDGSELVLIGDADGGGAGGGGGDSESRPIRGDATVRDALAGLSLGHELPLSGALQTTLRLNLDYVRSALDGYDESGDTSFELSFDERVRESLTARAGIELTRAVGTTRGVLLPQLGVDWIHESRDEPQRIVGISQETPSFGTVARSDDPDRGHGAVHLGLSLIRPNGLQLFAAFETLFAHDYRDSSTVGIGARLELR